MKLRTGIKVIAGIIGAILIGAIGSGVWEKILSPFLSSASSFLTETISALSTDYSDSIYASAARLPAPGSSIAVFLIIFLLVFIAILMFALRSKRDNKFVRFVYDGVVRAHSGWRGIVLACGLLAFVFFQFAEAAAITQIRRYSINQLEIVRPHVGEDSYRLLYSQFLQMKSENDFERFLEDLYSSAEKSEIEVQRFEEWIKAV